MRALVLTQEKLDNQREAVKEEKRLRVDNQPYASSFETADALAYDAFPYKHPVIGSMDDLQAASLDDARDFYRRYYAPANALLAVVGDVEPADAFRRVKMPSRKCPRARLPRASRSRSPPLPASGGTEWTTAMRLCRRCMSTSRWPNGVIPISSPSRSWNASSERVKRDGSGAGS